MVGAIDPAPIEPSDDHRDLPPQPASRYGDASEMRPRPLTAAAPRPLTVTRERGGKAFPGVCGRARQNVTVRVRRGLLKPFPDRPAFNDPATLLWQNVRHISVKEDFIVPGRRYGEAQVWWPTHDSHPGRERRDRSTDRPVYLVRGERTKDGRISCRRPASGSNRRCLGFIAPAHWSQSASGRLSPDHPSRDDQVATRWPLIRMPR